MQLNLFGEVNSFADEENFDNDSQTDRYLQFQYFNFNGNWPDRPLPLNLGNFNFTVENPFSDIDPNPIDLILVYNKLRRWIKRRHPHKTLKRVATLIKRQKEPLSIAHMLEARISHDNRHLHFDTLSVRLSKI